MSPSAQMNGSDWLERASQAHKYCMGVVIGGYGVSLVHKWSVLRETYSETVQKEDTTRVGAIQSILHS